MGDEVAVLIPIYKQIPNGHEKISLTRCLRILCKYPIIFVAPKSLDVSYYIRSNTCSYECFDDKYFRDIIGYNRLMLSTEFYYRFLKYKYILIYQLDAFVFHDNLIDFCNMGYDYIGASYEYIHGEYYYKGERYQSVVGNGGLSLRNVKSCLNAVTKFESEKGFWYDNEDSFFSFCGDYFIPHDFRLAPRDVAHCFSFECMAEDLYYQNGERLPFGCHAWMIYDKMFYIKIFKRFNINIKSCENDMKEFYLLEDENRKDYIFKRIYLNRAHYLDLMLDFDTKKGVSIYGMDRFACVVVDKLCAEGCNVENIYSNHPLYIGQFYNGVEIKAYKDANDKKLVIASYNDKAFVRKLIKEGMVYGVDFISLRIEFDKR